MAFRKGKISPTNHQKTTREFTHWIERRKEGFLFMALMGEEWGLRAGGGVLTGLHGFARRCGWAASSGPRCILSYRVLEKGIGPKNEKVCGSRLRVGYAYSRQELHKSRTQNKKWEKIDRCP